MTASNAAVVAAATAYTYIYTDGVEGISMNGRLGKIAIWENGLVERPIGAWPATAYEPRVTDPTWVAEVQEVAREWLQKAKA